MKKLLTHVIMGCLLFSMSVLQTSAAENLSEDAMIAIEKGVAVIDSWQGLNGGWPGWYMPHGEWWNVSSTSYCVRAIIAASTLGIESASNLTKAREYIISQQFDDGHWPGEHLYRGTKDALLGLLALNEPKDSEYIQMGIEWLRSQQSAEGYWEDGSGYIYTHSEILEGFATATSPEDPSVQIAVEWIKKYQQPDGSIYDAGYGRPVISTVLSIIALLRSGVPTDAEIILNAANWVANAQNPDGGWSLYNLGEPSEPSTTANALIALLEAGVDYTSEAVQNGIRYVVDRQQSDGSWVPLGWPEYRYYVEAITAMSVQALSIWTSSAPTKWAVVIGVDEYSDPKQNTHGGPGNSAMDMYDILVNYMNFPYDHVHLNVDRVGVSDDDVTKTIVERELEWLQKVSIPEDIVVFYYAGHGGQSQPLEYMQMHDTIMWDNDFAVQIDKIESQNLVVILDISYSGGFITDGQTLWQGIRGIVPSWTDLAEETPSRRIVLTACAENVGPWKLRDAKELPFWSGTGLRYEAVFTHYVVLGFKGFADENDDGEVTVEEAFRYARRHSLWSQTPMIYDGYPEYDGEGELYLGD